MGTTAQQPQFLKPSEVASRWSNAVTVGTLANWRSQGKGPAFQKLGTRVRYPLAQLTAWEADNMHGANDNQETEK